VPGGEWATFRGDLQRSAFYPAFPKGKLRLAWRKELWRELTGPRAEVIVADGRAFLGTYAGRMYAWNMATGDQQWVFETVGPIGHSPAYANGTVFFGGMDRRFRAVEASTGKERWSFETEEGIWVSHAWLQTSRSLVIALAASMRWMSPAALKNGDARPVDRFSPRRPSVKMENGFSSVAKT
jgi:hypothetical protein